jgi:hypothetical protein
MPDQLLSGQSSPSESSYILNILAQLTTFVIDTSDGLPDASKQKDGHIEQIHTNERVPGHTNYYEKNGLRTYGDDADHDHEPKMSFRRIMSLIAMAFCWSTRNHCMLVSQC